MNNLQRSHYNRRGESNLFTVIGVVVVVGIALGALAIFSYAMGWIGDTATVVREEFGPRAALKKYEWFKDVTAQLDKKRADIEVYQRRITAQDEAYEGTPRKEWPRDEREQRAVWESEVAGVTASYNTLAAEYNAQMSKVNWRFANVGELPEGAAEALPREFQLYERQ